MRGVLAHFIGDYLLQSHWMATKKTSSHIAAASHALAYSVPFLAHKPSKKTYAIIVVTHFFIDRFRLARYVVWAKDFIAPRGQKHELTATGMQDDAPPWLSTWLMILTDNLIHVIINGVALHQDEKKKRTERVYDQLVAMFRRDSV